MNNSINSTIGERLRAARMLTESSRKQLAKDICNNAKAPEQKRLTTEELEARLAERIRQWESGANPLDVRWIPAICDVLKCDVGYLFGDYEEQTRTKSDIVKETWLSEKAVQNILYMKEHDFSALVALSAFLETYLPGSQFGTMRIPDRDSAAGAVLGYIGMPKPSGSLTLSPDGTTVVRTENKSGLLPAELSALQVTLSDAARMVLHEKILKQLDSLREKNGGQYHSQTRNQDLENVLSQAAYKDARYNLRGGNNG